MWPVLGLTALGLYLEKLAGFTLDAAGRRWTTLLPIALLSAIVAVQAVTSAQALSVDSRVPGMAVAGLLLWRRANFLVVVVAASATTALVRYLGLMS